MKHIEHLQKDPVMAGLIQKYGALDIGRGYMVMSKGGSGQISQALFDDLASSVIGQLLSVKAAETIRGRVVDLCGGELTTNNILQFTDNDLRAAGLSYGKARCILNLAAAVKDNTLDLQNIHNLSNDGIIAALSNLKGIGKWTAEMFLIFSLGREDIFSHGDAGLKNAINRLYGNGNTLNKQQAEAIITKWQPYCSYACLYLWRSLAT